MYFNFLIIIIYLTFYLNFIFGLTFFPLIIIKIFFPKYSNCICILKNIVYSSISFISHTLLFKNIYVNSNEFIKEISEIKNDLSKSNIIISNHITELDFLIHMIIFSNTSLGSKNVGLAKKIIGYQLIIFGFFGVLTEDIFLHRKIEYDINKLNKFTNFNNLLIFPEGTCFNFERKNISDNYCDKNKLIKFNYHLYPRMTGLKLLINANDGINGINGINMIYDLTIIYDKISPNDYGNHYNLIGYLVNKYTLPNKIFIQINKHKIKKNLSTDKSTDKSIEKQIEKIFYSKDKFIENFNSEHNKFVPIEYNYIKGFGSFALTNILVLFSIYLFVKYSFVKYLFGIELIIYYIYFLIFV